MHKKQKKRDFFSYSFFPKNHRGLSAIITTLLIILLVLVAIGIVWLVVSRLIRTGAEGVGSGARCLNIDVSTTAINCNTPSACVVIFTRTGSDNDAIGGVKLVFFNETGNSGLIDESDNIEKLAGKTITVNSGVTAPNKVEVTVYLEDESGNEHLCDAQTTSSNIGESVGGNGEECDPECSGETPYCLVDTCVECTETAHCGVDEICTNNICVLEGCIPDCVGKVCGDDGCGGSCPPGCILPEVCGDDGLCYDETCTPTILDCASQGVECGIIYDDCGDMIDCDLEFGGDCVVRYGSDYFCNAANLCEQITFIDSGNIDNVWPPGVGIYFDDDELPKEDGLYYGKAAFFPTVDDTQCFLIVGYSYNSAIYEYSAIVELHLFAPLTIATGNDYQIWDEMEECTNALAP